MQAEETNAVFEVVSGMEGEIISVKMSGDWLLAVDRPQSSDLWVKLPDGLRGRLAFDFSGLGKWDTGLMVFLVSCLEEAGERGYYGRLLAYIEIDGYDFNESLISRGYARVYEEGTSSREKRYLSMQEKVISAGTGLWGDCIN